MRLADGTVLNLRVNGTEYESDKPVSGSIFTDNALSNVVIDGLAQGRMVLAALYDYNGGSRIQLRKQTQEEKLMQQLNEQDAQMTQTQLALVEVYEMLLG